MIRYINKVEWCEARHLRLAVPMTDNLTVYCADHMPYQKIDIIGLAELEVADSVDNGVRVWTSKLSAALPCRLPTPSTPVSLRLTATDGTRYLLGLSNRPYPTITFSDKHPSGVGQPCSCVLNAVLKGPTPALQAIS